MRIAEIVTRLDVGGVPDHVMTLFRGWAGRHDLTLITGELHPRHEGELAECGVRVERLPFARLPDPRRDVAALRRLRRILAEGRFDIAHTHMSKAALLGVLATRGLRGRPRVVNTAHNLGSLAITKPIQRALFRRYDRWLLGHATDHVVVVSARIREQVVAHDLMAPDHVTAIPNGIALARFPGRSEGAQALRRDLGVRQDSVLALCVARLVWFKGLDTLISALARAPASLHLAIAGAGELEPSLRAQATALGLADRVSFLGERDDVPALLGAADLFVLSSVSEGMPISILEAMASGLPVVATDVGGVCELVADGRTGLVVPPSSPDPLAAALGRLAEDAGLRQAMGSAGLERARAEFSGDTMAARTADLFARLGEARV